MLNSSSSDLNVPSSYIAQMKAPDEWNKDKNFLSYCQKTFKNFFFLIKKKLLKLFELLPKRDAAPQ